MGSIETVFFACAFGFDVSSALEDSLSAAAAGPEPNIIPEIGMPSSRAFLMEWSLFRFSEFNFMAAVLSVDCIFPCTNSLRQTNSRQISSISSGSRCSIPSIMACGISL